MILLPTVVKTKGFYKTTIGTGRDSANTFLGDVCETQGINLLERLNDAYDFACKRFDALPTYFRVDKTTTNDTSQPTYFRFDKTTMNTSFTPPIKQEDTESHIKQNVLTIDGKQLFSYFIFTQFRDHFEFDDDYGAIIGCRPPFSAFPSYIFSKLDQSGRIQAYLKRRSNKPIQRRLSRNEIFVEEEHSYPIPPHGWDGSSLLVDARPSSLPVKYNIVRAKFTNPNSKAFLEEVLSKLVTET